LSFIPDPSSEELSKCYVTHTALQLPFCRGAGPERGPDPLLLPPTRGEGKNGGPGHPLLGERGDILPFWAILRKKNELPAFPPESRNGGPIAFFCRGAGAGVACHAFSRRKNCLKTRAIVRSDGHTQTASFFAPSPPCPTHDPETGPVRSTECACLSFFPREKRDWPPPDGGLKNRLPIREAGGCPAFIPPHPALPHQGGGKKLVDLAILCWGREDELSV
jgi:hypothetical protein